MTYKRLCDDWLTAFLECYMPTSIAPESMLVATALFTLGAAIKRHVNVSRFYLGGYEVYPSVFFVFIARPGVATKSTTTALAEELLKKAGGLQQAPNNTTIEKLIELLADKQGDGSLWMSSTELANTVRKAGPGFFDILTELWDGRKTLDDASIGRGVVLAENPCVNYIAATTPTSVQNGTIPEHILAGGFGSRTLFVYETAPRQRKLFYHKVVRPANLAELEENLVSDLQHIANNLWGQFEIDDETADWMENYFLTKIPTETQGEYRKLDGYYTRKTTHIFKLAMLFHVSYSDEMKLYRPDFEKAIAMLDDLEPKMLAAFRSLGRNEYTVDIMGISNYVQVHKKVPKSQVLKEFMAAAEPFKLEQLLQGLIMMKKIEARLNTEGNEIIYYWIGD